MISVIELSKILIPPCCRPVARMFHRKVDRWWRDQKLYRWLRVFAYRGNQVYYPCCDGHFRRFIPYKKNGMCPHCDTLDRHRLLWLYQQDCTNIFRDSLTVLHIAPEAIIQNKLRASPNLEYASADLDSPLAMVSLDITDIPYAETTFDVVCSHVLECIPDDRKARREFYRILKPEG